MKKVRAREISLCGLFSALIAVGAYVKINTPWFVPFTLQFPMENIAALVLGGKLSAISVAIYIFVGFIGFPVFSGGGGINCLLKPSFGYIFGFLLGAYVSGKLLEKSKDKSLKFMIFASLINLCIVYIIGATYGFVILNFYLKKPQNIFNFIKKWILIFVPYDLVKCVISSLIAKRIKKMNLT